MTDKSGDQPFMLEEATIDGMQAAICAGSVTLVEIVQGYIDRVRAYNGTACMLVTEDGMPVPAATGAAHGRAGRGGAERVEWTAAVGRMR